MSNRLPNSIVLRAITGHLIRPKERQAIVACARRGLGDARDLRGIIAVAKELGAQPRVVVAAFGFLPDARSPRRYVDVWANDECTIALLPKGAQIAAAFALSRAVHPSGCSLAVE